MELYRTETANYLDNLNTKAPLLWIILRPVERDPPYELALVTADPAEGEAMTETGGNVVEAVTMPKSMQESIAAFVAEHHVQQEFVKRKARPRQSRGIGAPRPDGGRRSQVSDEEHFISRWSRRKREAADESAQSKKSIRWKRSNHRMRARTRIANISRTVGEGIRCQQSAGDRIDRCWHLTSQRLCNPAYQVLCGMRPFAAPGRPIQRSATL